MKKLVVLSGAGISAESGISTFRDSGGLWEGHDVLDVASPIGWAKNPELVLDFYNQRRKNVRESQPNGAHSFFAELEEKYDVTIVTQNVDDLHERGGSTNIIHLHGEILKAQSTLNPLSIYNLGEKDIYMGDKCEQGHQLRPSIVWFGEEVPKLQDAALKVQKADILIVIGTSLQVYPAAGLTNHTKSDCIKILVDPNAREMYVDTGFRIIQKTAVNAVDELRALLF